MTRTQRIYADRINMVKREKTESTSVRDEGTNKCSSFPLKRNEGRYKESDGRRNRVKEYWRDGLLEI